MIVMSSSLDKSQGLEQENEALKQKNAELEKYIESIKNATAEFKRLSEEAAINDVANKAITKIAKWIGISVAISFTGLIGLYFALYKVATDTAKDVVTTEFKNKEKIDEIKDKLLDKEKSDFTKELISSLKENQKFIGAVSNSLSSLLLTDPSFVNSLTSNLIKQEDFVSRTGAVAKTVALQSLETQKSKIDQTSNPELSNALQETLDSKRYFVVAASSEDPVSLKNPDLLKKVVSKDIDRAAYLCKPKGQNKRWVLLITKKNSDSIKLSLDLAKKIQNELVATPELNTAYILPTGLTIEETQKDNNIFFDITQCQNVGSSS